MSYDRFDEEVVKCNIKAITYLSVEANMDLVALKLELEMLDDPENENRPWILQKIAFCEAKIKCAQENLYTLRKAVVE